MQYFKGSLLTSILGLLCAYLLGGGQALFIVALLSILEVSLSFDNAIVNASAMKNMSLKWRQRFLTWGMLIAVLGMRIIFPILIVSIVSHLSPLAALSLAMHQPETYALTLASAHVVIMGFGGTFLFMVGLHFFLYQNENYWIKGIEHYISRLGQYKIASLVITTCIVTAVYFCVPAYEQVHFIIASLTGLLTFQVIHLLNQYLESKQVSSAGAQIGQSGLSLFIYLELLDASFSFDGVIGAFAISSDLFIIAIGLGIGAMFVRSLTILFVEKEVLAQYCYLEHGAFYAIIMLALMMFVQTWTHVPEVVTGSLGALFIFTALYHSIRIKRA